MDAAKLKFKLIYNYDKKKQILRNNYTKNSISKFNIKYLFLSLVSAQKKKKPEILSSACISHMYFHE